MFRMYTSCIPKNFKQFNLFIWRLKPGFALFIFLAGVEVLFMFDFFF